MLQQTYDTVLWRGASGTSYEFQIHPVGTEFHPRPGAYIFCHQDAFGWRALYVGEAENFNTRVGTGRFSHHKWESVIRHGATHICTLVVGGGHAQRLAVETDLRHAYNPPCNDQ
jgi:hypothetical protein